MLDELSRKDSIWQDIAFRITGNKEIARELVQEMYVKVFERNIDISDKEDSYFARILRNMFYDLKKKQKPTVYLEDYNEIKIHDNSEILNNRIKVSDALDELSLWYRNVLLLTHQNSLS